MYPAVFPAHAGVIPTHWRPESWQTSLPRACGGDPNLRNRFKIILVQCRQVFPAHAGVIRQFDSHNLKRTGLPRACGGDPPSFHHVDLQIRVFPARAGVIQKSSSTAGKPNTILRTLQSSVSPGPSRPGRFEDGLIEAGPDPSHFRNAKVSSPGKR